jgi:hypothetical protein
MYATYRTLALVSRKFNQIAMTLLYKTVELNSNTNARKLLHTMINRPQLGALVKILALNRILSVVDWGWGCPTDEQLDRMTRRIRELRIPNAYL